MLSSDQDSSENDSFEVVDKSLLTRADVQGTSGIGSDISLLYLESNPKSKTAAQPTTSRLFDVEGTAVTGEKKIKSIQSGDPTSSPEPKSRSLFDISPTNTTTTTNPAKADILLKNGTEKGSDEGSISMSTVAAKVGRANSNRMSTISTTSRESSVSNNSSDDDFHLIQREHEALKNELLSQQSLIADSFSNLRIQLDSKDAENLGLREKIDEMERGQRREQKLYDNLNSEVAAKEYDARALREIIDELTTKLLLANDVKRWQECAIAQICSKSGGSMQERSFTTAQYDPHPSSSSNHGLYPPVHFGDHQEQRETVCLDQRVSDGAGTDHLITNLMRQLTEKELELNKTRRRLVEVESELTAQNENVLELNRQNAALKSHVAALQIQSDEYRNYIDEHRQPVQLHQQTASSQNMESSSSMNATAVPAVLNFVAACPHCEILIADAELFARHCHSCRQGSGVLGEEERGIDYVDATG